MEPKKPKQLTLFEMKSKGKFEIATVAVLNEQANPNIDTGNNEKTSNLSIKTPSKNDKQNESAIDIQMEEDELVVLEKSLNNENNKSLTEKTK